MTYQKTIPIKINLPVSFSFDEKEIISIDWNTDELEKQILSKKDEMKQEIINQLEFEAGL